MDREKIKESFEKLSKSVGELAFQNFERENLRLSGDDVNKVEQMFSYIINYVINNEEHIYNVFDLSINIVKKTMNCDKKQQERPKSRFKRKLDELDRDSRIFNNEKQNK